MLKFKEANPLAVFGLRRVNHCPPHFTQVHFETYVQEKVYTDWIYENLSGRFYCGEWYSQTDGNRTGSCRCIAFESPGEASMFSLVLDQINKQSSDLW